MNFPLSIAYKQVLSSEDALDAFLKYVQDKGMELYPAQEEAILEIFAGNNVILNTPTGSGKSLVAEALHYYALNERIRSYYTSPIKALVNEKFLALCKTFGPSNVGLITGDASVNHEAPIICCTAEVLSNFALRMGQSLEVGHVVIDEFHYYSDRERGVAWQIPLLTLPQSRFLLMSATFGSIQIFAERLTKLNSKKTSIVQATDRPVPLDFKYSEDPLEQTVVGLVESQKAPIYIVNFTQRDAAETAQSLMSFNFCSKAEKQAIGDAIAGFKFTSPFGKEINRLLRHGVGIHHAGLLPKYRILVESLAQKGLLKLICGTDTLGVGVNIPLRTVLFTKLCKYDGEKTAILSVRDFHQISGRAGRKGFDTQGYVVAQAPAHVIENLKNEKKNSAGKKKIVKAKPPEKGFVPWNEATFKKLIESQPEPLQSRFQVNHGILLNVLSRSSDGCAAMRQILRDCHESDVLKVRHGKRAFQLFRSLCERKIIEIIPVAERTTNKVRVNLSLQEDFSLHQTLALFLLDTLAMVDPMAENYALQLLSLAESIVEDPEIILIKQLDRIKRQKIAELKEQGLDFMDRMTELEKLEYPKPLREFIYAHFNEFTLKHPWVGQENIKPKSVAREMFESYLSFADYIREYDLQRSEGLLLRYLSSVYRVLVQTIPDAMRNDDLDEIIIYFETMIKSTDSSLLDEWEKLKDPKWQLKALEKASAASPEEDVNVTDITRDERKFHIYIRNAAFNVLRALASDDYERVLSLIAANPKNSWDEKRLQEILDQYYETHRSLRTDAEARSHKNFLLTQDDDEKNWIAVDLTISDFEEDAKDWAIKFKVDVMSSRYLGKVQLHLESISAL